MLDAELLSMVRRLQVLTKRQVASVTGGAYASVFRGRGMEFDEVRPYVPGDDVRAIDWNVTARTGETHIKRFIEERELTVMLVVDMSSSLEFGSGSRSKLEAAAELAALLAMSAAHHNDKVGLLLFHAETELYIPPRKGEKHAMRVVRDILAHGQRRGSGGNSGAQAAHATNPNDRFWTRLSAPARKLWFSFVGRRNRTGGAERGGTEGGRSTSITAALEFCRSVLPRKTVMFLVSDFFDEGYLQAMRLAHSKHDLIAVRVRDKREESIPSQGLVSMVDAETGESVLVDTADETFRAQFVQHAQANETALIASLRASRVDLLDIVANERVLAPLMAFLHQRERRRSA